MKPVLQKVQQRIAKATSDLSYRCSQLKHNQELPALSPADRQIVEEMNREGVAVRSLNELDCTSTISLQKTFVALVQELEQSELVDRQKLEYAAGFRHCIPVNPSRIAREYPAVYLWGLNDRILNTVENCIGLPVAYHGVIVRREINDERQIGTRLWHQDQDDRNAIRITLYLNDVGIEDGPFEYIPKALTPSIRSFKDTNYVIGDEAMAKVVPPSSWKACTGSAGTIIFATTAKIFHHGRVPRSNHRRIAASYHYTSRQPSNPELCKTFSFQSGIPHLNYPLTSRQREALWEYQGLLKN